MSDHDTSQHDHSQSGHNDHDGHAHHVHVTPFWPMFNVFLVLIVLTILTVVTANIHELKLGNSVFVIDSNMHIWLALTIAAVKGLAVAAYFMHLRYDKAINTVVAGSTLFAVVLFLGFTLYDLASRNAILPQEGAGAAVFHPLANSATTQTDAAGSIFPGGSLSLFGGDADRRFGKGKDEMSVMEYVRQSAQAVATNPSPSEADHTDSETGSAQTDSAQTDSESGAAEPDTESVDPEAGGTDDPEGNPQTRER